MKLWQKDGQKINKLFEQFTIGNDPVLDLEIAEYDVKASIAHVNMLATIDLISENERADLEAELKKMLEQIENGSFVIQEGIEDCHSQIELQLTQQLGETGKKVHSGRSRNDQVLVALKLYGKDKLQQIAAQIKDLFDLLIAKSETHKEVFMPGYTHMQVAMPSSFGLWFAAYAESLIDDLIVLKAAYRVIDKNPLGSGAGYGSSFPLDRKMTTEALGFDSLNYNVVYAQMTRGKTEKTVANSLSSLAGTISKFCMDVCMYSGEDFRFFQLDPRFTTGSSIMPHKQNPDGFELIRGKCNQLKALPIEIDMILTNLSTGYHRDLQVLKESYVQGLDTTLICLAVLIEMIKGLEPNKEVIDSEKYDLLFTVEEVNKEVIAGRPFRDAYKHVGEQVKDGSYHPNRNIDHTHLGSIGNLANKEIKDTFEMEWRFFED